jgi:hypothetical protein
MSEAGVGFHRVMLTKDPLEEWSSNQLLGLADKGELKSVGSFFGSPLLQVM